MKTGITFEQLWIGDNKDVNELPSLNKELDCQDWIPLLVAQNAHESEPSLMQFPSMT